ncbi:MAG: NRDE family protein [Lutibacter sp.]|nr:NRDE family protein [Lutibacter sp.]MBP9601328.1 NRDE family protein [Lutibacter sp.]
MCTVTYFPLPNNDFILTSNRDEQKDRKTIPPKSYVEDGIRLVYPKDELAGGTWIGLSSKNRLVCVLNGAFSKHIRKHSYLKSRGVIAKEILKLDSLENYIEHLNLTEIEPFTMVIVDWNTSLICYELVWDEHIKHFNALENAPKIWSSSTLYSEEHKKDRVQWFQHWFEKNDINSPSILDFHHSQLGTVEDSILMKRSYVETVSITSVQKINTAIEMNYEDLVNAEKTNTLFSIATP